MKQGFRCPFRLEPEFGVSCAACGNLLAMCSKAIWEYLDCGSFTCLESLCLLFLSSIGLCLQRGICAEEFLCLLLFVEVQGVFWPAKTAYNSV